MIMGRNISVTRSEAEFLTDLLLSSDNPMAKDISEEIRNVFGMISEENELRITTLADKLAYEYNMQVSRALDAMKPSV